MNLIGQSHPTVSHAAQIAASKARASQKLKPASGLHAGTDGDGDSGSHFFKDGRSPDLSRSGTALVVPFRYSSEAPRLNAAFVAQFLGQIMPDHEQRNAAMVAAYHDATGTALVFDTRL